MGFGDTFGYGLYVSDNGNTYVYKASAADLAASGATVVTDPIAHPAWPYLQKDMRHVNSIATGGSKRGRLIIPDPTNALFVSGGTYSNSNTGQSYSVLGAEGERRPASHVR